MAGIKYHRAFEARPAVTYAGATAFSAGGSTIRTAAPGKGPESTNSILPFISESIRPLRLQAQVGLRVTAVGNFHEMGSSAEPLRDSRINPSAHLPNRFLASPRSCESLDFPVGLALAV